MKKHEVHRVRANLYISKCKSVKGRITKCHYCLKDITSVNRHMGTCKFRKIEKFKRGIAMWKVLKIKICKIVELIMNPVVLSRAGSQN